MAALPRVITVDPTWTIARIVRAAIDLADRPVIQVDVPGGAEALDEMSRGGYKLLVTALHIDDDMKGFELALRTRQTSPDTAVIILADVDDLEDMDEETRAESPFIYMRRPVDIPQFMRVLMAGLDEKDIFAAYAEATTPVTHTIDDSSLGPIPNLDPKAAYTVIDKLLVDISAMAIVLSTRAGDVLTERGAVGYINRENLTSFLTPLLRTTANRSQLVGGQASSLHFYDGDDYDVFVLSVGYHHFFSLIFDGQAGSRQFGAVTRFGRRAAEDLKALIGASATLIEQPVVEPKASRRKPSKKQTAELPPLDLDSVPLAKAEGFGELELKPTEEPAPLQLEPIANLDLSIFDNAGALDAASADDLFNPDRLAEIANESRRGRGPISYDEARELGIVP